MQERAKCDFWGLTEIARAAEKFPGIPKNALLWFDLGVAGPVAFRAETTSPWYGMTETEILSAYPNLEREDLAEALRYAATPCASASCRW